MNSEIILLISMSTVFNVISALFSFLYVKSVWGCCFATYSVCFLPQITLFVLFNNYNNSDKLSGLLRVYCHNAFFINLNLGKYFKSFSVCMQIYVCIGDVLV